MSVTWKILNIEYENTYNNLEKVARNVWWYVYAQDSEGNFGSTHGNSQLNFLEVSSETFTDFETLTEAQVIAWVKASLGEEQVSKIENFILYRVSEKAVQLRGTGLPSSWSN